MFSAGLRGQHLGFVYLNEPSCGACGGDSPRARLQRASHTLLLLALVSNCLLEVPASATPTSSLQLLVREEQPLHTDAQLNPLRKGHSEGGCFFGYEVGAFTVFSHLGSCHGVRDSQNR